MARPDDGVPRFTFETDDAGGDLPAVASLMTVVRRATAARAFGALILLCVGCNRSSEPVATVEETITKVDYLKEGNAICARGNERIAAAARQPVEGDDPGVAAIFVRVFVPGIREQIAELRALGYPEGDRETLEAIFAKAETYLRRAEQDPSTIDGHAFDDVNAELTAYGLRVCGS